MHIGVWIEGIDRLGTSYEGIWRIVKRLITSSKGTETRFTFSSHARFENELKEFIGELPKDLQSKITLSTFGKSHEVFANGETVQQIVEANHLDVDGWLIPNPMWSNAKRLIAPKIVWFHDFLLSDFPQSYSKELFKDFINNVEALKESGALFIFLSPYVRQKHGFEICQIPESSSRLIISPPIDATETLAPMPESRSERGDVLRLELNRNLMRWCSAEHLDMFKNHIANFPYEDVPFIFVSSQNRPHKGFVRLAQAHESLVRDHFRSYPMFTTALIDLIGSTPLDLFLKDKLFMGDFLSVGKVSDASHALLMHFAKLTIHPSTFEGNFPLPFAESVSVGTPCIVPFSRAYQDLLPLKMHEWVFYSASRQALVDKILDIEKRPSEFLSAQKEILRYLKQNSLNDYFSAHLEAFRAAKEIGTTIPKCINRKFSLTIWPPMTIAPPHNSHNYADNDMVMHWASYIDKPLSDRPNLFVLVLHGANTIDEAKSLALMCESGSWTEEKQYHVSDQKDIVFGHLADLPKSVQNLLNLSNVAEKYIDENSFVGVVDLHYTFARTQEIRVSGRPITEAQGASFQMIHIHQLLSEDTLCG